MVFSLWFCLFPFYGVIMFSYPGISRVNSSWLKFFIDGFLIDIFCFDFYYLVCLIVNLHYFIQFLLYELSRPHNHFANLIWWLKSGFLSFFKINFFQFVFHHLICLWLSFWFFFFLFMKLSRSHLFYFFIKWDHWYILIIFRMYLFIISVNIHFFISHYHCFSYCHWRFYINHVVKLTKLIESIQINDLDPKFFLLL